MPNAFASQPRKALVQQAIEYTVKVIDLDGSKRDAPVTADTLTEFLALMHKPGTSLLFTRSK